MEEHVAPVINVYWGKAEFPFEVLPAMAELGIAGLAYHGYGCPGRSFLADGFVAMELARIDPSMATFMGVHGGLAMGTIYLCGSEEQKEQWLPPMARMEKIGAFGLTEPDVGSGAAGGLTTTAKQEGDTWVLNGMKKWIGNATFADVTVIWARDVDDGNVKGFLVEKDTPGFSTEKMEHKIALRAVQNAIITLDGVRVPESMRLQRASVVPRHGQRAAHDPGQRGLAGRGLRPGRLRARPALLHEAAAVRPGRSAGSSWCRTSSSACWAT